MADLYSRATGLGTYFVNDYVRGNTIAGKLAPRADVIYHQKWKQIRYPRENGMSSTVFTADIDGDTLARANEVLAKEGMTLSEALRLMLNYIVVEGRMPHFHCIVPNEETQAAIADAERGDLVTMGSVAELMADLNEDD